MSGSREVELKFLCAPRDLGAVLAAAPEGEEDSAELISVYFDTPDLVLQRAGVSLRVRESKGRRVLTMKRGDGLSREEYEVPIESEGPNPDMAPLREILSDGDAAALAPAFNVHVSRRQRLVRYRDAEIELALDQGEVCGGRGVSPISEVELELKSGPPAALFDLARDLSLAAPLYLSFDTKSARGQALVAGQTVTTRRTERAAFAAEASVAAALQANARLALAHIAANAATLREAPHPEAVHQLRVAARRLRSAFSTFGPVAQDADAERIRDELRWLAHSCDAARNLDVFAEEVLEPAARQEAPPRGLAALVEAVAKAREAATAQACETAAAERFRALMVDATAWVETGQWLANGAGQEPARAFAARALDRRRRKLVKRGRHLAARDDAARHAVRIEAKKLRYAAEGFASLFREKRVARFVRRVKDLQDALGALNDIATAETLLTSLPLSPEAAFAAGELAGLRAAARPRLIAKADKAIDRLAEAEPFWS